MVHFGTNVSLFYHTTKYKRYIFKEMSEIQSIIISVQSVISGFHCKGNMQCLSLNHGEAALAENHL